jgi:hypothetical protein
MLWSTECLLVRALNILGNVPRIFINAYHSAKKKKKEKFMSSVRKYLVQAILNQGWIMKFSKQAWEYICAYHTIMQKESEAATSDTHLNDPILTPMKIEKLIKESKAHCCELDFDYSFIMEG